MGIEERIIKLIKSLDRIMDTWDTLTLRRTIVIVFTSMLLIQVIITTILWIFGRDISSTWMGFIGIEFGAFGTMLAYYFNTRGKIDEQNNRKNFREAGEGEEGE